MRVAVIGSRGVPAAWGGIERHVEELYARLSEMGVEPTVYSRRPYIRESADDVVWDVPLKSGTYRGMNVRAGWAPKRSGFEAFVHSFLATLHALRGNYDIYHYHATGPAIMSLLPRMLGKTVVATCHGLDWQRPKWKGVARRFMRYCERNMGRYVRNLIVVSRDLKTHFDETYNRDVIYIPNGAEAPDIPGPEGLEKYNLTTGQYICFFGRLAREKEVHTLIQAFQNAAPGSLRLAIVGGSSQSDNYIRELKSMAGDETVFCGYLYGEDMHRVVAHSRFVVNPSSIEGLPIVALEAYALGKRVLASDIPPHRELICDRDWLFQTGNASSLAICLRERLNQDQPATDEWLRQMVKTDYNWEKVARETLEFFRTIQKPKE